MCRSFSFLNKKDRASVITIARTASMAGSPPGDKRQPCKLSFDKAEDLMERGARSEAGASDYSEQEVNLPLLVHAHNFNHETESETELSEESDDATSK